VHELNAVRGLLGEPTELRFADIWGEPDGITATLAFGDIECVVMWVDLPGIARYHQELAFYAPDERLTLAFPSPFLRSAPTHLHAEGGDAGTASSWETTYTVAYDEAFQRELREFHDAIVEEREPRTTGRDALCDIALAQAIVRCHVERRAVAAPTRSETVTGA
jgi:predicted dehydrogenase